MKTCESNIPAKFTKLTFTNYTHSLFLFGFSPFGLSRTSNILTWSFLTPIFYMVIEMLFAFITCITLWTDYYFFILIFWIMCAHTKMSFYITFWLMTVWTHSVRISLLKSSMWIHMIQTLLASFEILPWTKSRSEIPSYMNSLDMFIQNGLRCFKVSTNVTLPFCLV